MQLPAILLLLSCFLLSGGSEGIGISGKFRNLTGRKLRLFWVNHEGQPYLNALVPAGGETSFATYATHKFFWAELHGPEVPTTSSQAKGVEFTIENERVIYPITDHTTPRGQIDAMNGELAFMKAYRARVGREWIAKIPRAPPMHRFRAAPAVGHTEEIEVEAGAMKWLCADENDPACRDTATTITLEVIALKPRVLRVSNFLSDYECEAIIEHHKPLMRRSTTGNGENAREEKQRTSKSARMYRKRLSDSGYVHFTHLADAVYRRLANAVGIPEELLSNDEIAEPFNIVHYLTTQEYTPHFDTGVSESDQSRFLSSLMYFNTPTSGGATSFPKSPLPNGGQGLVVPATKGSLVFFYDLLEDGNFDEYSIHAGEPVEEGEKWIAASWLWDPALSAKGPKWTEQWRTSTHASLFDSDGLPHAANQEKTEL